MDLYNNCSMGDINGMKRVILSVKPAYAHLLLEGVKTVELRRKFPVDLDAGTKCYIYASSPVQRIIGEVKISLVERLPIANLWTRAATSAMISWPDFSKYFDGLSAGYAISVYGGLRYDTPIYIYELNKDLARPPQSYCYLHEPQLCASL